MLHIWCKSDIIFSDIAEVFLPMHNINPMMSIKYKIIVQNNDDNHVCGYFTKY